ncbi:hypothetical protein REPUB_Repub07fG0086900 [Reevesia pubescens]
MEDLEISLEVGDEEIKLRVVTQIVLEVGVGKDDIGNHGSHSVFHEENSKNVESSDGGGLIDGEKEMKVGVVVSTLKDSFMGKKEDEVWTQT